jgi:hypothetical protein
MKIKLCPFFLRNTRPKKKKGFSKIQAVSTGSRFHSQHIFKFGKSKATPPTFLIENVKTEDGKIKSRHVLYSRRSSVGDFGSVNRPVDKKNQLDAAVYATGQMNSKYQFFNPDEIEEFLQATLDRSFGYNETPARIRWDKESGRFAIPEDILSMRILAQDYAKKLKAHLLSHKLCDESDEIKIYLYQPNNFDLHLKEYSKEEQALDCVLAKKELSTKNFHYLNDSDQLEYLNLMLMLDASALEEILHQHETLDGNNNPINLIQTAFDKKYFYQLESFLNYSPRAVEVLKQLIKSYITFDGKKNHKEFAEQFSNIDLVLIQCISSHFDQLANIIIHCRFENHFCQKKFIPDVFYAAAMRKDQVILKKLYQEAEINHFNCLSPLHAAIQQRSLDMLKAAKEKGFDINGYSKENLEGKTPLQLAITNGCEDIARWLIEQGADINCTNINCKDSFAKSPLVLALERGQEKLAEELINHKSMDFNSNLEHQNYFNVAIIYASLRLIKAIYAKNNNLLLTKSKKNKFTSCVALQLAIKNKSSEKIDFLFEKIGGLGKFVEQNAGNFLNEDIFEAIFITKQYGLIARLLVIAKLNDRYAHPIIFKLMQKKFREADHYFFELMKNINAHLLDLTYQSFVLTVLDNKCNDPVVHASFYTVKSGFTTILEKMNYDIFSPSVLTLILNITEKQSINIDVSKILPQLLKSVHRLDLMKIMLSHQ